MFYVKKVDDIYLLEAELKKLRIIYANLLKKPEASSSVKDVRRQIKVITGRINILNIEKAVHC